MDDEVVDFTGRRQASQVAQAIERLGLALPVLLDLPADSLEPLAEPMTAEVNQILAAVIAKQTVDAVCADPTPLFNAFRQVIPKHYGTEHYFALYATAIALMRVTNALISFGQEVGDDTF